MLRRLTRTSVSVWVACVAADPITLTVRRHAGGPPPTTVTVQPTRVGANLWMAVLTAGAPGGAFVAGEIYEYELTAPWEATRGAIPWNRALAAAGDCVPRSSPRQPPPASSSCFTRRAASPTAAAATGWRSRCRSCRRASPPAPPPQPHLLVLSGDQIYADEVGHPLMPRVLRVARDLVGVDETTCSARRLRSAGEDPAHDALGYTGATANHLWTYGEFMAMYLLAWSPVLWPAALPAFPTNPVIPPDVDPGVSKESWDEELLNVELFRAVLPEVRRVLANVPSLMIFDDHEITDDWNIDHAWVNSVYDKPGGRRAVTNGVLAYALCQHWGNKPAAFTTRRVAGAAGARRRVGGRLGGPADEPGGGMRARCSAFPPGRCPRRRPRRCCAT